MAWSAVSGQRRSVQSVQALTEAAPASAADGIPLYGIEAVVAVLTAPNGQTFNGTGEIRAYYYSDQLGRWIRAPRADEALADLVGLSEGALPALPVISQSGKLAYACNGVGLSGGAAVTITLLASSLRDGGAI